MIFNRIYLLPLILLGLCSCSQQGIHNSPGGADNKDLLQNWASEIIVPAYEYYQEKSVALLGAAEAFDQNPTDNTLADLKKKWHDAYLAFQKTMIFDFKISSNIYYLSLSNTYPTQPVATTDRKESIEGNIALVRAGKAAEINFGSTSRQEMYTYQGFPALDYLLYAPEKNLHSYQTDKAARTYVVMLCRQLKKHIDKVVSYWKDYKFKFGLDDDASVNSDFTTVVNAFIRVYEKQIRANKVGYAAGAIREQNGKAAPDIIEAYYNGSISKELLLAALHSSQDFFNGNTFDGNTKIKSLSSLLSDKGYGSLVNAINDQYTIMYQDIEKFPYTLKEAAVSHPKDLKHLYDLIQENVLNFKTKMMAALNVQPNYLDTDGD